MPLYEYECQKCHHRLEKIQKFSDAALKKCPDCGGKLEKVISAPAVQFKGSGWYVTDYPKKSGSSSGSSSSSSDGDSAKSDSAEKAEKKDKDSKPKTETKSESKKTEKK